MAGVSVPAEPGRFIFYFALRFGRFLKDVNAVPPCVKVLLASSPRES
jgi:hypothetical protein